MGCAAIDVLDILSDNDMADKFIVTHVCETRVAIVCKATASLYRLKIRVLARNYRRLFVY